MTIQQCIFKAKQQNPVITVYGLDLQLQLLL